MILNKAINIDDLVFEWIPKKICTKCGIEKSLDEFYKQKKYYYSHCKKCHYISVKIYRKNNINKVKEWDFNYNNKEQTKQRMKEYYIDNKNQYSIRSKEYYKNNKDRMRKIQKKYNIENKEKVYNLTKKWVAKNPEKRKITADRHAKKASLGISDSYVKSLIRSHNGPEYKYITCEMIKQKRAIVKLKRSIKHLKQKQNETSKC